MSDYKYKRVLLKLSGEAISGDGSIIDFDFLEKIAETLVSLANDGVEIGVIIGAGNIWRGRSSGDMDRSTADSMGMLGTVINALAAKDAVIRAGGKAIVMTSTFMEPYARRFTADTAREALEDGNIVFFGGGTGAPYFSTDTAGILRANEINADVFLLAKNIDGIYDRDPKTDPDAVFFDEISYSEMIKRNLKGIDLAASALGSEFGPDAFAFRLSDTDDIVKAIRGESRGTKIVK
ncbi:MAG: uridine monophosphate kinase [Eubacteriales bacterium]